ncbi:hypothetical protein OMW55_05055 [Sphingomonas sp. BN140010]|uniref:Lipoprotein n=1 Tax=Sphingomonas arvum TaxID=2992113 RepID=A0ABT3JDR2_9SPHN|nr:hypothetical protein [Sphingomonas sp. BN140010]MCW3797176.1 hypothetical protein [Sphingomonas sp. BN140010]
MSSKLRVALLCAVAGMPAACATPNEAAPNIGADFGEATKYNAALQTIDPDPVYPADASQPGTRADTGTAAVKRMRTDNVKQPQIMTTGSSSGPR